MNELLVWWYLWVNSNYDVLIMTVTLVLVAGLIWDNRRLNRVDYWLLDNISNLYRDTADLSRASNDQIKVNVHLAEDIDELQKRLKEVKTKRKIVKK